MSLEDKANAKAASAEQIAALNGEVTSLTAQLATAQADASKFAAAAQLSERERIAAIMNSEAAAERPKMAAKLAFTTHMTAEEASSFMADLPAEKTASVTGANTQALLKIENGSAAAQVPVQPAEGVQADSDAVSSFLAASKQAAEQRMQGASFGSAN